MAPTPSRRSAGTALAFPAFGRTFRSGLSCRRAREPPGYKEEAAEAGEEAWCRWLPCWWGDVLQEPPCPRPLGGLGVLVCVPVFRYEHLSPRRTASQKPIRHVRRPRPPGRAQGLSRQGCGGQERRRFPDRAPARGQGGFCAHRRSGDGLPAQRQLLSATGPSAVQPEADRCHHLHSHQLLQAWVSPGIS